MKFQHELFYHTIPIFENMIKDLTPADIGALDLACHELKGLFYTFMQHGRYADEFVSTLLFVQLSFCNIVSSHH